MNKITLAQQEALDVVKDMIDKSNTSIPDYGTKIITLILGILNVDSRVTNTITDITDIKDDKTLPINPNKGNDKIHINIPDWIKSVPTPPFVPGDITQDPAPWKPQVWYNRYPEPIQTDAQQDVKYRYPNYISSEVNCTGDKSYITSTYDPSNCIKYNGDLEDTQLCVHEQTSFNDK